MVVVVIEVIHLSLHTNRQVMMLGQRQWVNVGVLWQDFCTTSDRQAAVEPQGQVDMRSLGLQGTLTRSLHSLFPFPTSPCAFSLFVHMGYTLCIMDTFKEKDAKSIESGGKHQYRKGSAADILCSTLKKTTFDLEWSLFLSTPLLPTSFSNASPDVRSVSERFCGLLAEH